MTKTPKKPGKGGTSNSATAGTTRARKVRVKPARERSNSPPRWLARQLNDPYVHAARRDGYRSRAAYKLLEMDDRYRLLRPGARVVDLGCAPGGWCQVAVARVKAEKDSPQAGRVIGL